MPEPAAPFLTWIACYCEAGRLGLGDCHFVFAISVNLVVVRSGESVVGSSWCSFGGGPAEQGRIFVGAFEGLGVGGEASWLVFLGVGLLGCVGVCCRVCIFSSVG